MADSDIIKEFLVTIGYKEDASSRRVLDDATKKLEKSIIDSEKRKEEVRDKAAKANKERVRQAVLEARLIGDTLESLAKKTIESVTNTATSFESLYYASRRIGTSIGDLKSFTYAVGQMGGSFEGAMGSLEGLASKIRRQPGYGLLLKRLGVDVGPSGEIRDISKLRGALLRMSRPQQFAMADILGIDDQTLQAILDGVGKFANEYKAKLRNAGLDPDSAGKVAVDFNRSFRSLIASVEVLWDRIMIALMRRPTGGGKNFFEYLTEAVDKFTNFMKDKTFGDIFQMIVDKATLFAQKVDDISDSFKSIAQNIQSIAHFFGLAPVPDKLGPVKPSDFPKGPPHPWWDPFGLTTSGVGSNAGAPSPPTVDTSKQPRVMLPGRVTPINRFLQHQIEEQEWAEMQRGHYWYDPGSGPATGPVTSGQQSSLKRSIDGLSHNVVALAKVIEKQILTDAFAADKPVGSDVSGAATGPTVGGFRIPGGITTPGGDTTPGPGSGGPIRGGPEGLKKAQDFVDYFAKKYGVDKSVAQGVTAWLFGETSGTMSPTILGPHGDLGYAQWVGPRKAQLLKMFSATDEGEKAFMDYELTHNPQFAAMLTRLRALHGPNAGIEAYKDWGITYQGAPGAAGGWQHNYDIHLPYYYALQGGAVTGTGTYPAANAHAPRSGTPGGTYPDWLSMQSRRELAELNSPLVRDLLEVARRTGIHFQVEQGIRTWADAYRNAYITHRGVFMSEHLWRAAADLTGLTGGTINQFGAAYEQLQRERHAGGRWGARFRGLYDPYHFDQGAGYGRTHAPDPYGHPQALDRRATANGAIVNATTTINVHGAGDAHSVASMVAAKQSRVNSDLLRNLAGSAR